MMRDAMRHSVAYSGFAVVLFAALAAGNAAAAADFRHFPGASLDQRMLRIQEQVEDLYREQDFERAILIYEKDLAPSGDKYAQYMVGYMTLTGRGVAENPVQALAWYQLAAERDENHFVQARDALAATLNAEQLRHAAIQFADLWRRLGDRKLLLDQLQKDLESAERYADSDLADNTLLVSGFMNGSARSGAYRQLRDRMDLRLKYLASMPDHPALAADIAAMKVVEADIRDDVAKLADH